MRIAECKKSLFLSVSPWFKRIFMEKLNDSGVIAARREVTGRLIFTLFSAMKTRMCPQLRDRCGI